MDWRDYSWYHAPDDTACEVCGQVGNCGIEPRFGYIVCEKCSNLSPVEVGEIKYRQRTISVNGPAL